MKWVILILVMFTLGVIFAGCDKADNPTSRVNNNPRVPFCSGGFEFDVVNTSYWYCIDPFNRINCMRFNTPGRYCVSKL